MSVLELHDVGRSFDGVRAVDAVSIRLEPGEIVGLIGPNGAGKSTLFNLVAGALRPSTGRIFFNGRDITGFKAQRVAALGLARTFQIPKPFGQLTVVENVMLGAFRHMSRPAMAQRDALAVLDRTGLADYAAAPVSALTVGLLKRLEVARALAARPNLVLFDEIMAGLTPTEIKGMTDLILDLPGEGVTVLWVEHVLHAIMGTANRILVLNRGSLIADGPPAAVARDPLVVSSYLGEGLDLA
jgi:branched-chain amino acid transport system ATP-binding protein